MAKEDAKWWCIADPRLRPKAWGGGVSWRVFGEAFVAPWHSFWLRQQQFYQPVADLRDRDVAIALLS